METSKPSGGYADLSALPGWAPSTPGDAAEARTIEVDGETFSVHDDEFGGTHYEWSSGPNPGYGFAVSPTPEWTDDDHRACIRSFLAQVDPDTGYIEDD